MNPILSILIPTHNRANNLKGLLSNISEETSSLPVEVIVIDNNSTDSTKKVAEAFPFVRYVFEPRTSFTAARNRGGLEARGQLLCYLDDDVHIQPGSIATLVKEQNNYPNASIFACKIVAMLDQKPPAWVLDCQKNFNGWSLLEYPPSMVGREILSAYGPMMVIRKRAFQLVGGFPPDTIGVETNTDNHTFHKLYVGPGDYGFCLMAKKQGLKTIYFPQATAHHIIPSTRMTVAFWRSRAMGEGYYHSISLRNFYHAPRVVIAYEYAKKVDEFIQLEARYLEKLNSNPDSIPQEGMWHEELWLRYYLAYFAMEAVLKKYNWLPTFLWEMGMRGVSTDRFQQVQDQLPAEYLYLTSNECVENSDMIVNLKDYDQLRHFPGYPLHNPLAFLPFIPAFLSRITPLIERYKIFTMVSSVHIS